MSAKLTRYSARQCTISKWQKRGHPGAVQGTIQRELGSLEGRGASRRLLSQRVAFDPARAILHHDIESAGRENSAGRRKIDLPMRGK